MPERRARRPGRLVEVDRSLLERHEERQAGEQLRHGRPRHLGLGRTLRRDDLVGPRHSGGRGARAPAFDGAQRLHPRDTRNVARVTVPAVSPYADTVGYCRAVRDGRHIYVSGTAPVGIDSDDPYEQAKRCLTIIVDALRELGAAPEHVVRTRVYIVDPTDWEAVGRAHGEVFGEIRPASAMLSFTGTLNPAWKVEIEADALLPE